MAARTKLLVMFALLANASCVRQSSREVPIPPAPTRWVTDNASFLSAEARARIDERLAEYERTTDHQVIVWIAETSGERGPELFATRAFEAWRVGRAGLDDGLVLFIFSRDRTVRIEVGYGLEDRVTDLDSARVIREVMVPRLARGDADGAVAQGVDALLAQIQTPAPSPARQPEGTARDVRAPRSPFSIVVMVIFGVLFLILLVTNPRLALLLLFSMGGHRHGGFGGGGGFSGGGGRSGGGGATGGW